MGEDDGVGSADEEAEGSAQKRKRKPKKTAKSTAKANAKAGADTNSKTCPCPVCFLPLEVTADLRGGMGSDARIVVTMEQSVPVLVPAPVLPVPVAVPMLAAVMTLSRQIFVLC